MTDPIISTKKVEEIILQEIPEGFFPKVRKDDLSTYINLLLRGEKEVPYKKDLSRVYATRHYARHLSEVEKVLDQENRIPGFNLSNQQKKVLKDFIMKRLSSETFTIEDAVDESESMPSEKLSLDELLLKMIALDQERIRIEEVLMLKTMEEQFSFLEKISEDDEQDAGEGEEPFFSTRLESISESDIRKLLRKIWNNHKEDIVAITQQRIDHYQNYTDIGRQLAGITKRERTALIKRFYEAIEFKRLKELPNTLKKYEWIIEGRKKK